MFVTSHYLSGLVYFHPVTGTIKIYLINYLIIIT